MLVPVAIRCRIPELLEKIGKDQRWLAARTGIREQRISEMVNLHTWNIRLQRSLIIADCLKCKVDELFEWEWRQEE